MTSDEQQIAQAVDRMQRVSDDAAGRLARATEAGQVLAAAVIRNLQSNYPHHMPETNPLYKAYCAYMALDSGGFAPPAVSPSLEPATTESGAV